MSNEFLAGNQHLIDLFNEMLDLDLVIGIDADYLILHDTLVDYFIEEIFVVIDRDSSTYALIRFNRTPECAPQLKLQQYLESPASLSWKSFSTTQSSEQVTP
jgi:hypothetical protein